MSIKKYIFAILFFLCSAANGYGADWCVQVSTFRNLEGSRQDFKKIKHYEDARIEKTGGLYSLRIGYFNTDDKANEALTAIREVFPNAFIRKCTRDRSRVIESAKPQKPKQAEKSAKPPLPAEGESAKPSQSPAPASAEKRPNAASSPPTLPPAFNQVTPNAPPKAASSPLPPASTAPLASKPLLPATPSLPASAPPPEQAVQVAASGDSDPKKLFDEAEKHRSSGNYTLAIDFYKKIPQLSAHDGELAGRASYRAALCYDIIGEKKMSEAAYAGAVEKWPGLDMAPAAILYAGGTKAYDNRRYGDALKIFSAHQTLYPDDSRRAEYMMACTLMQQGRMNAALLLFNGIIERYPDSSEATESIVALGHIGLMSPKVRATMFMKGYEWTRDPISAYDAAIKRQTDPAAAERISYIKGCALMVLGRYEEAQRALFKCLKTYPLSYKIKVYQATVGLNLLPLCRILYEREDYAGVVSAYFHAAGNQVPLPVDAATVIIIGRSLNRMGLNEDASNFLKAARIKSFGKDAEEIGKAVDELGKASGVVRHCDDILKEYREKQAGGNALTVGLAVRAADCLYTAKQYGDCLPIYQWALGNPMAMEEKRWVLLRTGKACQKTGNPDGARKAFGELKATGADEFWSKLTDFTVEDVKWTEKYNQLTKRKYN